MAFGFANKLKSLSDKVAQNELVQSATEMGDKLAQSAGELSNKVAHSAEELSAEKRKAQNLKNEKRQNQKKSAKIRGKIGKSLNY